MAEHLGARPGLLPAVKKTSPLTPQSSRLCGDRDLSLHLHGQHHPITICLSMNGHAHKISFFPPPLFLFFGSRYASGMIIITATLSVI